MINQMCFKKIKGRAEVNVHFAINMRSKLVYNKWVSTCRAIMPYMISYNTLKNNTQPKFK